MDYSCVHCEGKAFTTLRGWKQHMSTKHGGYDETDVAQASGSVVSEENVEARMQDFASTISQSGELGDATPSGEAPVYASAPPVGEPARPPVRTVKATPKRLKKVLSAIPTKMLEGANIELDDEDKEALEEAGDFLVDVFGVEFEIDQQKRVLKSRFWAFVWVGGVALLIYVKHRFSNVWEGIYNKYKEQMAKNKEEEAK